MKKEAITAFWMPKRLNPRVRFILTSYGKNNAAECYSQLSSLNIQLIDS